jgi:hypothetical protein
MLFPWVPYWVHWAVDDEALKLEAGHAWHEVPGSHTAFPSAMSSTAFKCTPACSPFPLNILSGVCVNGRMMPMHVSHSQSHLINRGIPSEHDQELQDLG